MGLCPLRLHVSYADSEKKYISVNPVLKAVSLITGAALKTGLTVVINVLSG